MSWTLPPALEAHAAVFLLAFIRVSGIFLITPFFSGPTIPTRLKIGLAFFLTACLAPALLDQGPRALVAMDGPLPAALTLTSELAIGFLVGMAGATVLGAVQTAGHLVAQDIGVTIANVIDPITSIQVSIIAQLKVAAALFVFIGLDFHHQALRVLAETFRLVPLGGLGERLLGGGAGRLGEAAIAQGSFLFEASVRLALPVTVTLLLVTVAMGFLSRAVPEMNVFIIGFGLRLLVGLWVLVLSVPLLIKAFQVLFERASRDSGAVLRALGT